MKRHLALSLLLWLAAVLPAVRAAVVYSGVEDIAIPQNFAGVYLNISTGATAPSEPGTWSTAPWLNPFFGGVGIGNSALLQPIVTGTAQIVNLPAGTTIGAGANFVLGESGSSTHVGPAANQFQPGVEGYIGYQFQLPGGGGADYYGWLGIQVNNAGAGTITDWAYQNTPGAGVAAGSLLVVPEAGTALPGIALCGVYLMRRRRGAKMS